VREGRIAAIAERIAGASREIDASGLIVMPGGIDSHVHLAQLAAAGLKMADDFFFSGTRAAIAGGNTTVLPFALQPRGMSLRASVMEYHKEADGKCLADYGFHLIITDPSASVLGQELPALVEDGYSSFKVFMTYDDLMLNDRQLLEVFECARSCRALVMVHCRVRCRHRAVGRQPEGSHPAGYLHHGADYTPYEGLAVTGWPVMTILRGKVVAEEGKILGEPGDGSFLRRGLSPFAAAARAA